MPELRDVSYRWSSQTSEGSPSLRATGKQGGGGGSRCCLSAYIRSGLGSFYQRKRCYFQIPWRRVSLSPSVVAWTRTRGSAWDVAVSHGYLILLLSPGRPAPGESRPEHAEFVADLAWDFAIKEGFRVFESLPAAKPSARRYSTWARQGPFLSRSCGTWPCPGAASVLQILPITSLSGLLGMAQGLYCKLERILEVQWSLLISQLRWTLRPLLDLKVRHLPSYSSFAPLHQGRGKPLRAFAFLITSDTWHSESCGLEKLLSTEFIS